MVAKKRDKLAVIFDILSIIRDKNNSIKPTPLLRLSNLSSQRFAEYIPELINKGFIFEFKDKSNKKFFSITQKGFKFLEKYYSIKGLIEDLDL